MIVKEVSYEVTDPTVNSQIVTLKGSGANVFFSATTNKFAAQAIRKAYRYRLEADPVPGQQRVVDRDGADAGRVSTSRPASSRPPI